MTTDRLPPHSVFKNAISARRSPGVGLCELRDGLDEVALDEVGVEQVQAPAGAQRLDEEAKTRTYAWVSTIPHFLYFTALRNNQPVWYQILVWTSGLAAALAVVGLVLGVMFYRRGRATWSAAIPYAGWMRWHYVTGLVFGVFSVTWAFSGLVSMEPWAWTNQRGIELRPGALTGGRLDLAAFKPMDAAAWDEKYAATRHNAGWMLVDALSEKMESKFRKAGFEYWAAEGRLGRHDVVLVAP